MTLHHDPKPKGWGKKQDPKCKCGGPLWIVIRPGEHIHPCPVHPDYAVYGREGPMLAT